jgi:hypothetical protein
MIDPSALIAAAQPIPVHWGLLEGLRVALFLVHLVGVNILLGGALIAAAAGGRPGALPEHAARSLNHALPTVMALTVNLGVPPLLFIQAIYGHFFYASSILMGWYWLAVVGVLIAAYYGLYIHDAKVRAGTPSKVILAAAALLALNAFIYVCNLSQTQDPKLWTEAVGAVTGWLLPLADPSLAPRYLHFLTGSVAMAGLALALAGRLGWFMRQDSDTEAFGLRVFRQATYLQIAVGVWFLVSLPRDTMLRFMGASPMATILFILSLTLTLAVVIFAHRRFTVACAVAGLGLMAAMVLMREAVRLSALSAYFHPETLPMAQETGPAVFFAVILAAGVYVLYWLALQFRRAGKEA